ncbi:tryptophan--tRNA ligase [Patescibacteria group bacterium]|nr:MAG: tryptophan--tRNA ligase [Patescibacteria group bacterium]
MSKPVILTGLRANNDLHIGNYFGALLPFIDMAKRNSGEYQINLFMPDLHSFTTPIDHSQLQTGIRNALRIFVAAGLPLDNTDIHIYRQSRVPAHSELTVILNSFTGMGEMERMTQYKDKSAKLGAERISVGLFDYPVLMASDILLYGATYVPVGDDQTQHLEFTRDIAQRMNAKFGELFTVPKAVKEQHTFFGKDQGLRIKDLQDPTRKMSKSDESGKGIIFLGDDPKAAAKKIMSATTDNVGTVNLDYDAQPGISNLLQIYALLSEESLETVAQRYQGRTQYGELKKEVAEKVEAFLVAFQADLAAVDDVALDAKLVESEKAMNEQANEKLKRVQEMIGLR